MKKNNSIPKYNNIEEIDNNIAASYLPVSANQVGKYKRGYTAIPLLHALLMEELFFLPVKKWQIVLEKNKIKKNNKLVWNCEIYNKYY